MYQINEIIAELLVAGGLGFINFYTLEHMGKLESTKERKELILPICLFFSLLDFAIYQVVQSLLRNAWALGSKANSSWLIFWSVVVTAIIAFALTLILGSVGVKLFYALINKARKSNGEASLSQNAPFEDVLAGQTYAYAYVYDFSHQGLGYGEISGFSSDEINHYQINLLPFTDNKKELQPSYDELMGQIETSEYQQKYHITQHINFKQKFIMIVIEERN